jgi:hypothetical protein
VGQRYKGLKGKYWVLFSEYVRRRDLYPIWHVYIISCGQRMSDWRKFDAGHFIPAGGDGFVNGECPYDNAFNGAHLLLYRRGHDARYGPGATDALEERYRDSHSKGKVTKEWSKREILEVQNRKGHAHYRLHKLKAQLSPEKGRGTCPPQNEVALADGGQLDSTMLDGR